MTDLLNTVFLPNWTSATSSG